MRFPENAKIAKKKVEKTLRVTNFPKPQKGPNSSRIFFRYPTLTVVYRGTPDRVRADPDFGEKVVPKSRFSDPVGGVGNRPFPGPQKGRKRASDRARQRAPKPHQEAVQVPEMGLLEVLHLPIK